MNLISQDEVVNNNQFFKKNVFIYWLTLFLVSPVEFELPVVHQADSQHCFLMVHMHYIRFALRVYHKLFNEGSDPRLTFQELTRRRDLVSFRYDEFVDELIPLCEQYKLKYGAVVRQGEDQTFSPLDSVDVRIAFTSVRMESDGVEDNVFDRMIKEPVFAEALRYFEGDLNWKGLGLPTGSNW